MNNRSIIIDYGAHPNRILGYFDDLETAKERCDELRKEKYNELRPMGELEYDETPYKMDMNYSVVQITPDLY